MCFFRRQPNMKCIIFVNRIVTAISLAYILQNLKFLSYWKCDFLVGVHSGLKSMSRKTMNIILDKFRSNEVMLHSFVGCYCWFLLTHGNLKFISLYFTFSGCQLFKMHWTNSRSKMDISCS